MNGFDMVSLIVVVSGISGTVLLRTAIVHSPRGRKAVAGDAAETGRLREEVGQLKERLQVIERITVEKENSLERGIEGLRNGRREVRETLR